MIKGKLVRVRWRDAADNNEIAIKDVKKKSTRDYMIVRETFGIILKKDKHGLVMATDIDDQDLCEIVAIPKPWIIK